MSGPLLLKGFEVELFTGPGQRHCGSGWPSRWRRRFLLRETEPDHRNLSNTSPTPMPITTDH